MLVLGVDPGSLNTGFGLIRAEPDRVRCLEYGVIRPPASGAVPLAVRLLEIHLRLSDVLQRNSVDVVAVERLFHAVNAQSALVLGHARGVALLAAAQAGAELAEYTPLEVKKAVAGYGKAEKSQVQSMVRLLLGLEEDSLPLDASDALAVALCHSLRSFSSVPRGGTGSWRNYRP